MIYRRVRARARACVRARARAHVYVSVCLCVCVSVSPDEYVYACDIYTKRCTGCGYDFERNWHVRPKGRHVHDHAVGNCSRCGSKTPKTWTGRPTSKPTGYGTGFKQNGLVSVTDTNKGTKDTHLNFGEDLDDKDWEAAGEACGHADLCVVMGTSLSLRHVTHLPFMAKKTVIVNLQQVRCGC